MKSDPGIKALIAEHKTVEDLVRLQAVLISTMQKVNAKLSTLSACPPPNHEQTPAPDSDAHPSRWLWRKN